MDDPFDVAEANPRTKPPIRVSISCAYHIMSANDLKSKSADGAASNKILSMMRSLHGGKGDEDDDSGDEDFELERPGSKRTAKHREAQKCPKPRCAKTVSSHVKDPKVSVTLPVAHHNLDIVNNLSKHGISLENCFPSFKRFHAVVHKHLLKEKPGLASVRYTPRFDEA